jgi:hypothetical protein
MTMTVETKSASLDTLAVTIQALHVNGKQMTLAVFRQLPCAEVINEDGSLAPIECWGLVRYSIKDEGDFWVVCASGGRLYRSKLRLDLAFAVKHAEHDLRNAESLVRWWKEAQATRDAGGSWVPVFRPSGAPYWRENGLPELEAAATACLANLETAKRRKATFDALLKLPQLFIAV